MMQTNGAVGDAFIDAIAEQVAERIAEEVARKVAEKVEQDPVPEWMSMKQAAAYINMDYYKFAGHVRKEEIPSHEIFGVIRINRAELDALGKSFGARYPKFPAK